MFVFLKKYNKIALKDVPGSIHILLEGKTHNNILIVAIGSNVAAKQHYMFYCSKDEMC
jgi:hypothetical protein